MPGCDCVIKSVSCRYLAFIWDSGPNKLCVGAMHVSSMWHLNVQRI